jgi:hypothetical protein
MMTPNVSWQMLPNSDMNSMLDIRGQKCLLTLSSQQMAATDVLSMRIH